MRLYRRLYLGASRSDVEAPALVDLPGHLS